MTDPVNDLFNSIRNALMVKKEKVSIPFSDFKFEIVKILEKRGLIEKVEKKKKKTKKTIEIALKYVEKIPVISGLKRISKPGQKIYLPARKIKKVKGGYGIAIVSTSKGLMTNEEARKQNLGGEVICEIW